MERYATIDIGTNSMRLLLLEMDNKRIISREKIINGTRIGASVDEKGFITPQGLERNLIAYKEMVERAKGWGASNIWSIATSAVRDAKNGAEFTQRALEATGVPIKTISGEEEAELGYKGVLWGIESNANTIMVIDIGGGSTEIIIGNVSGIIYKNSLNIGAVRMTERLITSHPISKDEYQGLVAEINKGLDSFFSSVSLPPISLYIGIGGTATTLGAMDQRLVEYDMEKIHRYGLKLERIEDIKNGLKELTIEEKKMLRGLHPKRADIILAGTVILELLMKRLSANEIILSEYDNLEGLLISEIDQISN